MSPTPKKIFVLIGIILFLYLIYASIYIYNTSFVVAGERYFVLFDDAMISMRYAKNFAEGQGLVWNPGEAPVEGYTNPLWVIFMALFHLLPISASKISLTIQISGAIFLAINLYFVFKIAQMLSKNILVPLLATILTAFYTPLNNWGLQGMEVSILVLILSAVSWMVLRNLKQAKFSVWPYVLLGIGTLIRVDMAVPYLVILIFLVMADPENRKPNLAWGLGLLIAFLGSQTVFRYLYYGDPLPNTYYLKMSGFPLITRLKRGLYVLFMLVKQMNWVLCLLPFTVLLFRRDRTILLLFAILGGQIAYSIYVGGDAWEHKGGSNRYIALAIPMFFTLFVYAIDQVFRSLAAKNETSNRYIAWATNLTIVAFTIASMVNFNLLINTRSLERWLLLRQPDFIEANKEYIDIVNELEKFTTPQTRIAVVTAGAIPYFSELPAIDLLGKNDPIIAHQPNHLPNKIADIRPGHMKWDYDYTIGELHPDIIVQVWGDTETAQNYSDLYYVVVDTGSRLFTVREDSTQIIWENITVQPEE